MTPRELAMAQDEIDSLKIGDYIRLFPDDPLNEPTGNSLNILCDMIYWAVERKEISSRLGERYEFDENFEMISLPVVNLVSMDSLKEYLSKKSIYPHFFFPPAQKSGKPEYLDPNHPRYAPKLAAAVEAWLNVTEVSGTSPKQALMRWLRKNAARFGLTGSDGMPAAKSVDGIATVANWNQNGGAPKTPRGTSED